MSRAPRFTGPWAICPTCSGDGAHSRDLGAFTMDELNEQFDPDEQERYFAGGYDRTCENCGGSGKVRTPGNAQEEQDVADAEAAERERYYEMRALGCYL